MTVSPTTVTAATTPSDTSGILQNLHTFSLVSFLGSKTYKVGQIKRRQLSFFA